MDAIEAVKKLGCYWSYQLIVPRGHEYGKVPRSYNISEHRGVISQHLGDGDGDDRVYVSPEEARLALAENLQEKARNAQRFTEHNHRLMVGSGLLGVVWSLIDKVSKNQRRQEVLADLRAFRSMAIRVAEMDVSELARTLEEHIKLSERPLQGTLDLPDRIYGLDGEEVSVFLAKVPIYLSEADKFDIVTYRVSTIRVSECRPFLDDAHPPERLISYVLRATEPRDGKTDRMRVKHEELDDLITGRKASVRTSRLGYTLFASADAAEAHIREARGAALKTLQDAPSVVAMRPSVLKVIAKNFLGVATASLDVSG